MGGALGWSLRLRGWFEERSPSQQIAPEGGDAECDDHDAPGAEEKPPGIGEKRVTEGHGGNFPASILPARGGQSGLAPGNQELSTSRSRVLFRALLLGSGGGRLLHVLLHARLVVRFQLLQFGLLVRSQHLIHLVVNTRLGHGALDG